MDKIIIGIDIGGSTTKIVGFTNDKLISPLFVKASDPLASVYGAFGKFLNLNSIALNDIEQIMITGVGSSFVTNNLYGIPTAKVDEFRAIGVGGLYISELTNAVIVSMGTGTAFVKADEKSVRHLGGTGIGGGTLLGLSNKILNVRNFHDLIETAHGGILTNVDLTIGDITRDIFETLPHDATAANFGKISDLASRSDLALGIINLVFQVIGTMSVFAARTDNTKHVVLTGNLTNVAQAEEIFLSLQKLYGINFHLPANAEFATAIGAALIAVK